MLLPEAFRRSTPKVLLAFDETGRTILGAAAYHIQDRALFVRRVRVIRNYRRQGVGSALMRHLTKLAGECSLEAIRAHVDTLSSPEPELFLAANGMINRGRMWVAQIDVEAAIRLLSPLRERLVASGRVPQSARVVEPAEAPVEEAGRLCAAHMESEWSVHPAFFRAAVYRKSAEHSSILLVDGQVAGVLIVEGEIGKELARVIAHVIAPEYRWGWANIVLLTAALERAHGFGVRRVTFEALEDNLNTVNLIQRLGGETVQAMTRFERLITPA